MTPETKHRGSATMADPTHRLLIVRRTNAGFWRVFNVVTREWVGNATSDEHVAQQLLKNMESVK